MDSALQGLSGGRGVSVGEDADGGPRQSATVDEARVVGGIGDDKVLGARKGGNRGQVGLITAREGQGGGRADVPGDGLFQGPVGRKVAANQAAGGGANPVGAVCLGCSLQERGMPRKPEVVIGTEI